jgi:chloramphenicol 3-O-phosphotransferase
VTACARAPGTLQTSWVLCVFPEDESVAREAVRMNGREAGWRRFGARRARSAIARDAHLGRALRASGFCGLPTSAGG